MSLRRKYFLIFLVLFTILSTILSMTAYFLSNHILIKKYKELSYENVSYILDVTDRELNQLINTFYFISNNSMVIRRLETKYNENEEYDKMIDDVKVTEMINALGSFNIFHYVKVMYIYSDNGEEYWYKLNGDYTDKKTIIEYLNAKEMNDRKLTYLGINYSMNITNRNNKVLQFSKNLYNEYGEKIGKIYFELDTKYFEDLYDNERIMSGTTLVLIDNDNKILYSKDSSLVGTIYHDDDFKGIIIENDLKDYGWKLISKTPQYKVLDESKLIIQVTALMTLISVFLSIIMIFFVTKRIVEPISKLSKGMTEVMKGNLDVNVDYESDDEIGWLTDSFNKMTSKLKDNLEKEIAHTKALNDAEYKALQAQINPHFMYNSLNTLRWMASIQNADNIINIVEALWRLLRITSSLKGQFITLEDELKVIKAYTTIQEVRYKGKFEINYEIEKEHLKNIVPKYILQPFVENSIFHGIEPKKGTGIINIESKYIENELVINISDDGVGMSEDKIKYILSTQAKEGHNKGFNNIGVKNVDERLKLLYGHQYGVIIKSKVGVGTTVSIRIPQGDFKKGV